MSTQHSSAPHRVSDPGFKDDDDSRQIWVDMPGFTAADIKISLENNFLKFEGFAAKDPFFADVDRVKCGGFRLKENTYKLDEIKTEVKNGVLRIVLPKIK